MTSLPRNAGSFFAVVFCLGIASASDASPPALTTVPKVDLGRYIGRWHELARFPNRFQKDCRKSLANYSLRPDGKITVINECSKGQQGEIERVEGEAEVVDSETWAKLRVNFVPTWMRWSGVGWGNYWIIDLGKDYEYAVVSEPNREYLWVLSRTPELPKAIWDKIIANLKNQGFTDLTKLIVAESPTAPKF